MPIQAQGIEKQKSVRKLLRNVTDKPIEILFVAGRRGRTFRLNEAQTIIHQGNALAGHHICKATQDF